METAKVYRNGAVRPGKHSEEIYVLWGTYDRIKPPGRAGRVGSVYASPSLAGMVRWTHTNHMGTINANRDMKSYEIQVRNPEELYVYDVRSYENTCSQFHCYGELGNPEYDSWNAELIQPYWDSGIPFTDWEQASIEQNLDPMDWEVLIPMESIVSSAIIPDETIINAAPEDSQSHLRETLRVYSEWKTWVNREKENDTHVTKDDMRIIINVNA